MDDKDVCQYVEGAVSGCNLGFYIDNIIDKKIEPVKQMQLHVVVRPRPCIFNGKIQQKTFVTIEGYQKQHKIVKKRVLEQVPVNEDQSKSSARRKSSLEHEVTSEVKTAKKKENNVKEVQVQDQVNEVVYPKLTKYEEMQRRNVAHNKAVLESMGINRVSHELRVLTSKGKTKVGAVGENMDEGTDEYIPYASEEESVQHVTKKKKTKVAGRPTTRSQTNVAVTGDKEKQVVDSVTVKEKGVQESEPKKGGSSSPAHVAEKIVERPRGVGKGSMAAFLELHTHKIRNEANQNRVKDLSNIVPVWLPRI